MTFPNQSFLCSQVVSGRREAYRLIVKEHWGGEASGWNQRGRNSFLFTRKRKRVPQSKWGLGCGYLDPQSSALCLPVQQP